MVVTHTSVSNNIARQKKTHSMSVMTLNSFVELLLGSLLLSSPRAAPCSPSVLERSSLGVQMGVPSPSGYDVQHCHHYIRILSPGINILALAHSISPLKACRKKAYVTS